MGLLSRFGVGGGSLDIALENSVVVPGGELRGNVLFKGGKRAQEINSIKLTAWCALSSPPTPGMQVRTTSQVVVPERDVSGKFTVQPGETKTFPFSLQIPAGAYGSTPDQVRYHLHTSADIDKEVDPGDTQEFVVQGPPPPAHALPSAQAAPGAASAQPAAAAQPAATAQPAAAFSPPATMTGPVPPFAINGPVWGRYHDRNWYAGKVIAVQPGSAAVQWADERMGTTWIEGSGLRGR